MKKGCQQGEGNSHNRNNDHQAPTGSGINRSDHPQHNYSQEQHDEDSFVINLLAGNRLQLGITSRPPPDMNGQHNHINQNINAGKGQPYGHKGNPGRTRRHGGHRNRSPGRGQKAGRAIVAGQGRIKQFFRIVHFAMRVKHFVGNYHSAYAY
ncbi:hypothetical protein SDC9_202184 [bioreactor metagenome]|uniref:Uncharacterized protein n=1 Tax=bioreactor metagenome TaxID=1076179 RepID=A0A645J1Y6_9ZZZZ